MVLTGSSMGSSIDPMVAVKFGINTTLVVLEMVNFTRLRFVKFIPISNTTLVVFIPNFTATHAIVLLVQTTKIVANCMGVTIYSVSIYVTRFVKRGLPHTSNLATKLGDS